MAYSKAITAIAAGAGVFLTTPACSFAAGDAGKTFVVVDGATLGRNSHAGTSLDIDPVAFEGDAQAVTHRASGVRLPREHQGCRLVAIKADAADPTFALTALAEYDCRPAKDLTYVTVRLFTGLPGLAGVEPVQQLAMLASKISRADSDTPTTTCAIMDMAATTTPNRRLLAAQCGARWSSKRKGPAFGTATVVFGQQVTQVALTNTCADIQCFDNRPLFARFVDTFDLSAIK